MIRIARKDDIDSINLLGETLYHNFQATYDILSYLTNSNYIILVNEEDVINAFLLVYSNIDYFEIEVIIVEKEHQNKGIATNILNYFFDHYTKKGDELLLEVSVNNNKALNLYEKFGFKIINTRKKYYNDLDAYVMKKVK